MPEPLQPMFRSRQLSAWAVPGVPEVSAGDDLADLCRSPLLAAGGLRPWDVVVVTHKAVAKSEGRSLRLAEVRPGAAALDISSRVGQSPELVEVILRESSRVVRAEPGLLVTETVQGLVCANAGVDRSNAGGQDLVTCLPLHPDASAERLRRGWLALAGGGPLGVIVSDTFGRPFREGSVNVAIGVAGMPAVSDHRGLLDQQGYLLHASLVGTGDEIAGIGELVMGKLDGVPLAVVRGLRWEGPEEGAVALQRDPARDVFRR